MKDRERFYHMKATTLQGQEISMEEFQGMVVLVVNTASKCGFTPQYAGLEQLYRKYRNQGFVVLGFPSNQFARQEPGGKEQIEQTCYVNYGVSFPMFEKIQVNGRNAHPLYQYLSQALPGTFGKRIPWNFTKFLIDAEGKPVKRFPPKASPESVEPFIQELIER